MHKINARNNQKKNVIISIITFIVLMTGSVVTRPAYHAQFDWLFDQESLITEENRITDEDLKALEDVYNSIQVNYVEEVDKIDLLTGALKGMVDAIGDPYSEYLNAEESTSFEEDFQDSFEGIGVQFMMENGRVTVISPIDGTPAGEAGLLPNDIILEADDVELSDMNTNEVVKLIRGPKGSDVKLLIQRNNSTFDVVLTRDTIPNITVTGEIDASQASIGHVKISQFADNTYNELVDVVHDLRSQGATSLIVDLRMNPGGLLDSALDIGNMFLEDGDMIMQISEKNSDENAEFVANERAYGSFKITEPYTVLIDEGSASASEILAAAVQENTDSKLIGQTSFGKGTVQTILNQSEIGELKLTSAKWLTPSGNWIHDVGIEPDILVEDSPVASSLLMNSNETLEVGVSNEFVESLSLMLNALGYEVSSESYFDETVEEAVKAFQTDNELEADGKVTGDTAHTLNRLIREHLKENDPQYDAAIELLLEATND
ncbi:S41 family peptidase [Fundicoccus sp. Sow4_D5]|uniref:S41 family peptidase n=1 Tax=Fundicoccus sp. Sow4_D5 TaxID=3438782 RepID=UPI003F92E537